MRRALFFCLLAVATARIYYEDSDESNDEPTPDGEIYAVLVAGSNGWYNYRHQADVAHSYHTLLNHGVDPKNIIVMMYDDIANNKQNPYPGKLFNSPKGKDVYAGLKIDYSGKDVTPANFLNILKGNSSGIRGGNGRVLESGSDDRVFVYFTDHGAVGLISFPNEILTVKDLNEALVYSAKNDLFKQLVFYLEACESGSMFTKILPDNINIYAITAASADESSWGTYCENPLNLPCLGDLFSVNWMEDSDVEQLSTETILKQFQLVKRETNKSHVQHYGDFNIESEPVGWFQGMTASPSRIYGGNSRMSLQLRSPLSEKLRTSWPVRDIEVLELTKQIEAANDAHEAKKLEKRLKELHEQRHAVRRTFKRLATLAMAEEEESAAALSARRAELFTARHPISQLDCHHDVVLAFDKLCIDFNKVDYALKYVYVLNNLCVSLEGDSDLIIRSMVDACV